MRRLYRLVAAALLASCAPETGRPPAAPPVSPGGMDSDSDELQELLRSDTELSAMLDEAAKRRIQILVAVPAEGPDGKPTLRRMGFRADVEYFYPASAVKLCAAFAAVEKLEDLRAEAGQRSLHLETPVRFVDGEGPNRSVLETTLRGELEKSLVLSDNESHNRLFDFVGRDELGERMARLGIRGARVVHSLGGGERRVPPVVELLPGGAPIAVAQRVGFELPPPSSTDDMAIGSAHRDESGRIVPRPMDFSTRNSIPLRELQNLLVAITRPDLMVGNTPRIEHDREALLTILGTLPSQLTRVASARHVHALDEVYKPLHVTLVRELAGHRVRVFGKGGQAYGFTVVNAYAVDDTTGRSFFVAATIYANDNDTLNDDRYAYASVSSPFLIRLGEVLARAFLAGPVAR